MPTRPCFPSIVGLAVALSPLFACAAEPPPVQTGLWDVRLLTTFEHKAAPTEPPGAPRARSYRICIGPDRARAPMLPGRLPAAAELVFDRQSVSGSYPEPSAAGAARHVDFNYRRLAATAFEGSLDRASENSVTRTQYFTSHVAPDCGALAPSAPGPAGEP